MSDLLHNGFLLLIPVFVMNMVLYRILPDFFKPAQWDNIPKEVLIAENLFRYLSFLLPITMIIGFTSLRQKIGLALYLFGLLVYFSAWLIQIKNKQDKYDKSIIIRGAPAYTPIIWLIGIGLLFDKTIFSSITHNKAYFFVVIIFTVIHTYHAYLVVKNSG